MSDTVYRVVNLNQNRIIVIPEAEVVAGLVFKLVHVSNERPNFDFVVLKTTTAGTKQVNFMGTQAEEEILNTLLGVCL